MRRYESRIACRSRLRKARRTTNSLAKAATSMTTLAARPAGTHGDSSACNIHQSTKNNAPAAAAAAVMYPEVDGERANLFFRGEEPIVKMLSGGDESTSN